MKFAFQQNIHFTMQMIRYLQFENNVQVTTAWLSFNYFVHLEYGGGWRKKKAMAVYNAVDLILYAIKKWVNYKL